MTDEGFYLLKKLAETKYILQDEFLSYYENDVQLSHLNSKTYRDIIYKELGKYFEGSFLEDDLTQVVSITDIGKDKYKIESETRDNENRNATLEVDLLWYQTKNAKAVFDDYPRVNRQARNAIIWAVINTIATILLGLISLKSSH